MTYGNSIRILAERSWCYDVALPPVSAKIELFVTRDKRLSVRARAAIRPGELICYYAVVLDTRLFPVADIASLEVLPNCKKKPIVARETQSFGNESHFIEHADYSSDINVCFRTAHMIKGAPAIARASPIFATRNIKRHQEILLGYDNSSSMSLSILQPSSDEFLPGAQVVFTDMLSRGDQGFVKAKTAALFSHREESSDYARVLVFDAKEEKSVWEHRPYTRLHPAAWMCQRDSYNTGDNVYYRIVDEDGYWRWIFATVLAQDEQYEIQIFGFLHNCASPSRFTVEASDLWVCLNEGEQQF